MYYKKISYYHWHRYRSAHHAVSHRAPASGRYDAAVLRRCWSRRYRNHRRAVSVGNYLTSGDLALWESRRFGDGYGYGYGYRRSGAATTGIGLAAGLGGGALLLAIAGIWGMNQASKARSKIPSAYNEWDFYVALNAQYHDYCAWHVGSSRTTTRRRLSRWH